MKKAKETHPNAGRDNHQPIRFDQARGGPHGGDRWSEFWTSPSGSESGVIAPSLVSPQWYMGHTGSILSTSIPVSTTGEPVSMVLMKADFVQWHGNYPVVEDG